VRFETEAKQMMVAGEFRALIEYEKLGREAMLSISTPDHYLPHALCTRDQAARRGDQLSGAGR
jgi:4,5-DOPA dioxygenase extradiol